VPTPSITPATIDWIAGKLDTTRGWAPSGVPARQSVAAKIGRKRIGPLY
jgi:hypothetical protein